MLIIYSLYLRLAEKIPAKQKINKSSNATVDTGPIFKAIQLGLTTGKRLMQTIALKISCFAISSAIGGEHTAAVYVDNRRIFIPDGVAVDGLFGIITECCRGREPVLLFSATKSLLLIDRMLRIIGIC